MAYRLRLEIGSTKLTLARSNTRLPSSYNGAIEEKALALHARIPQLGVVNWDMTVNSGGEIVLIEANTRSGSIDMAQSVFGRGIFGDDTDAILEYLRDMRKLYPFNYR